MGALVFSSFSGSLDCICTELRQNEFANNPNVSVFVLTVRTGAVGITLNSANHVFMMEPTMNPALHIQAINRVYRLGQTKKCHIHTMIMKGSIEQRIWNINKDKLNDDQRNENKNQNLV